MTAFGTPDRYRQPLQGDKWGRGLDWRRARNRPDRGAFGIEPRFSLTSNAFWGESSGGVWTLRWLTCARALSAPSPPGV